MGRQQRPSPPPGLFSTPGSEDAVLGWAIPVIAAVVLVATCGVWLAAEISWLTGGHRQPGWPVAYARAVLAGRAAWPDAAGWSGLAAATVVLMIVGFWLASRVTARRGRAHRCDQVARYLAPRRDRVRLGPRARAAESGRLDGPGAVLATTNKRDMSDATLALRGRRGRTWLFDPQGLASNGTPAFTYDLLAAVTDVSSAQKLAAIF